MNVNELKLKDQDFPQLLGQIARPPVQIFTLGVNLSHLLKRPRVAIVGSRKATAYGRSVTNDITTQLVEEGVVIISGLAYGIDACAHQAAIKAGGQTIAVLPSPLSKIYPAAHGALASKIVEGGGLLLSEYRDTDTIYKENFIARNRLVSALADVVIIPEAAVNSGSLHTARFALEQGKTVMAVPGNINNRLSEGCNNLIKSGAVPLTTIDDVIFELGLDKGKTNPAPLNTGSPEERQIIELIANGINSQEELAASSSLTVSEFSSTLTALELKGSIRPLGGGQWTVAR